VQVYDRPANIADWLVMRTVGDGMQASSWESLLESIVAESGATSASSIQHEEEALDDDKTQRVEAWIKELVLERKRRQSAAATTSPDDQPPRKASRPNAPADDTPIASAPG